MSETFSAATAYALGALVHAPSQPVDSVAPACSWIEKGFLERAEGGETTWAGGVGPAVGRR